MTGDETGVRSEQLDYTQSRVRLNLCVQVQNRFARSFHCGHESERLPDPEYVVIHCLRDAHDRDSSCAFMNGMRGAHASVTTDNVEDLDFITLQLANYIFYRALSLGGFDGIRLRQ